MTLYWTRAIVHLHIASNSHLLSSGHAGSSWLFTGPGPLFICTWHSTVTCLVQVMQAVNDSLLDQGRCSFAHNFQCTAVCFVQIMLTFFNDTLWSIVHLHMYSFQQSLTCLNHADILCWYFGGPLFICMCLASNSHLLVQIMRTFFDDTFVVHCSFAHNFHSNSHLLCWSHAGVYYTLVGLCSFAHSFQKLRAFLKSCRRLMIVL